MAWAKFGPESERAMKWNFIQEETCPAERFRSDNAYNLGFRAGMEGGEQEACTGMKG